MRKFAMKSLLESLFLVLAVSFLGTLSTAMRDCSGGEFNPDKSIGDTAPAWTDLPGTDGKKHSLGELSGKEVVVVAFTCNSCPYAVDYQQRIIDLAAKYSGDESKVAVVAINVNAVPADSFEKMKERAEEAKFNFLYLFDESQQIAKEYGAGRTPEFFVLNKDRQIVYMGAFDDSTKPAEDVRSITSRMQSPQRLAAKKPAVSETAPVGCAIRWAKERKRTKK
jgi:peroxiredoxin